MKGVLFLCLHNSGRSQMAEAFLNSLANGRARVASAGTDPAGQLNPTVVQAMAELGLNLSGHAPKLITQEMVAQSDLVITMGCSIEEDCPSTLVPTEDWGLEDPQGKPLEEVRAIRDEIRERVRKLVAEM